MHVIYGGRIINTDAVQPFEEVEALERHFEILGLAGR